LQNAEFLNVVPGGTSTRSNHQDFQHATKMHSICQTKLKMKALPYPSEVTVILSCSQGPRLEKCLS